MTTSENNNFNKSIFIHKFSTYIKQALFSFLMLSMAFALFGCKSGQAPDDDIEIRVPLKDKSHDSELLPQTERSQDESTVGMGEDGVLPNPFSGSLTLSGLLVAKTSRDNIAIIEYGDTSYIIKEKDTIADYWNVENITDNGVLLKHNDKELLLNFIGK